MRELERLIARAQRYGDHAAMLFVDLDGLKMINDSFGHTAGDEALIQVADLLVERRARGATAWRGSAATSSRSCSTMPTRQSAHETAARLVDQIAGCEFSHDGDAAAAQRRDRRRR